ncbi:MAG: hypothetical protein EP335_17575 [Alphaproteobacteria bacterium]|nr:MAG: hypothetical protein EP335_17575 [Alphaproteobacteria bacterium]
MTHRTKLLMAPAVTAGLVGFMMAAGVPTRPALAGETEMRSTTEIAQATKDDLEFARKLRELKQRQNEEWNDMIMEHEKALQAAAKMPEKEKLQLQKDQVAEKKNMQRRHERELDELKAAFPT